MNKREMIHLLIDSLLDVEETSKKGIRLSLSNDLCHFYFKTRDIVGSDDVGKSPLVFFNSKDAPERFAEALAEIELVKNTPDVEPKVTIQITEEKARELGLIA